MTVESFADTAINAGLRLVQESQEAIANKTAFDPDTENCFKVFGRLPAVRVLRDLTEDQRHDMFIEGFRRIPPARSRHLSSCCPTTRRCCGRVSGPGGMGLQTSNRSRRLVALARPASEARGSTEHPIRPNTARCGRTRWTEAIRLPYAVPRSPVSVIKLEEAP
jgi:hypothetical protein